MAKRKVTNLTDVSEITCVVQKGKADDIVQSLLDAGIQGATVHSGVGTGIREIKDNYKDLIKFRDRLICFIIKK